MFQHLREIKVFLEIGAAEELHPAGFLLVRHKRGAEEFLVLGARFPVGGPPHLLLMDQFVAFLQEVVHEREHMGHVIPCAQRDVARGVPEKQMS